MSSGENSTLPTRVLDIEQMLWRVLDELLAEETGDLIAILDLAWPDGLQTGLSEPVALLLDEDGETLELANAAGFLYFVNADNFKAYVREKILALEAEEAIG